MNLSVAQEIAHQMGLVPFVAMLALGRKLPRAFWLVALAFAVSWVADSFQFFSVGGWRQDYFYMPVQVGLVLWAFLDDPIHRLFAVAALLLTAVGSVALSWPGPDILIALGGSIAVLAAIAGPLTVPIYVYFGTGTVAYLLMIRDLSAFLPWWYAYQGCRALAFIAFVVVLLHARKRGGRCVSS